MPIGIPTVTVNPNIQPTRDYKDGVVVAKKSKKAVLIQNKQNRYAYANEDLAKDLVEKGEAILMRPTDHDYLHAMKAALGTGFEGFKPGEPIQLFGEIFHAEEIGRTDTAKILAEGEEAVKKAHAEAPGGVVKPSEEELKSFSGKKREGRFTR